MPRPTVHKTPKPPKYAEPHTVEVADLESYTVMAAAPPYSYLPRSLPQNVVALMLANLWREGKRYVRIYLPAEVFKGSYANNPAMFAQLLRNTKKLPFEFITMRAEPELGRFRITAAEKREQKRNSYMATAAATLLGELSKHGEEAFSVVFPYEGMTVAYQNDQFVFRFRLEKAFRQGANDDAERLRIAIVPNGYKITRIPKDFPEN